MGLVYEAQDIHLHRSVALKFLLPEIAQDPQSLERFHLEAEAASALNHPNICVIYDIGQHEKYAFIAMEYLEGKTLKQKMAGRPLDIHILLDLAIEISDGLDSRSCKSASFIGTLSRQIFSLRSRWAIPKNSRFRRGQDCCCTSLLNGGCEYLYQSNYSRRGNWNAVIHVSRTSAWHRIGRPHRHLFIRDHAL